MLLLTVYFAWGRAIIYTIIYDIEMVLKEKKIYFFKFYFLEKDLVRLSFYFPLFITASFLLKTHSGSEALICFTISCALVQFALRLPLRLLLQNDNSCG